MSYLDEKLLLEDGVTMEELVDIVKATRISVGSAVRRSFDNDVRVSNQKVRTDNAISETQSLLFG